MRSSQLLRNGLYALSFVVGRSGLFAAPLLLSNLLARSEYGQLETAQAAASLTSNVVVLGMGGLVPLVLLQTGSAVKFSAIITHHLIVAISCGTLALLITLAGLPSMWALSAVLCAAISVQSLLSIRLKTLGKAEASVLLDAGLFIALAGAAMFARLIGAEPMQWVWGAAVTLATLLSLKVWRLSGTATPIPFSSSAWLAAVTAGTPLMVGGLVSLLATTSGRLGMGLLADPLMSADYAVLSRAAAIPIVMHQLILIARFRNLFTQSIQDTELSMRTIIAMVAVSALSFWIFSPLMRQFLGPAFDHAWREHMRSGVWIVGQSVLWSAISLNDLAITRLQIMSKVLPIAISSLSILLIAGALIVRTLGLSVENFVMIHSVVMILFYAAQCWAISRQGTSLWRPWILSSGIYIAICGAATQLI